MEIYYWHPKVTEKKKKILDPWHTNSPITTNECEYLWWLSRANWGQGHCFRLCLVIWNISHVLNGALRNLQHCAVHSRRRCLKEVYANSCTLIFQHNINPKTLSSCSLNSWFCMFPFILPLLLSRYEKFQNDRMLPWDLCTQYVLRKRE